MKIVFTLFFTSLFIYGQSQQLLSERKTASAMANGGAVSLSSGIESMFSNPAGLIHSNSEIIIGAENLYEIPELTVFRVGFCYRLKRAGIVGLKLSQFGKDNYVNQEVGFLYSLRLFKNTSLGVELDLLHTRIREYGQRSHFNFEIGFQHQINSKTTMGISIYGPYSFQFSSNHKIPSILAVGMQYSISDELKFLIELEKQSQSQVLVIFAINYELLENMILKIASNTGKHYGNISGGFDIRVKQWLYISLGFNYDQLPGLSSGLGLRFSLF